MKYREITVTFMEQEQTHIIIEREDGSFKSFPKDLENNEYQSFLENIDQYEKVVE